MKWFKNQKVSMVKMTLAAAWDNEEMEESGETARKVDAYWAVYFGIKPKDLKALSTLVVSPAALQGYDGALAYRHGDACIVSVPSSTPEIERRKLREATPEQAFDPKFLARVFVINADNVSDPAWVGVADRGDFRRIKSDVRMLGDSDEEALVRMADACGEMSWAQSTLEMDPKPMFGKLKDGEIVAVSAYRVMGGAGLYRRDHPSPASWEVVCPTGGRRLDGARLRPGPCPYMADDGGQSRRDLACQVAGIPPLRFDTGRPAGRDRILAL